MAWATRVSQISRIEPIPGADKIETAYIGEWPCVVSKHKHHAGEIVAYIMQDSIVPDNILAAAGLTGKLSGPDKNRVKAIKLRGQRSVGLLVPAPEGAAIGDCVADRLGIGKYEPPVPIELADQCAPLPPNKLYYDVDHWNSCPDIFTIGDPVVYTEKLDGSHTTLYITQTDLVVCSRNYALVESENNAFWRAIRDGSLNIESIRAAMLNSGIEYLYLEGELLPASTLKYGHTDPKIYWYDVRDDSGYWEKSTAIEFIKSHGGRTAPVLYSGPFGGKESLEKYANGSETLTGFSTHIREGLVATAGHGHNRRQAKYISFAYMER